MGGDGGEGGLNPDKIGFVRPSPSQRLSEPAATLALPPAFAEAASRRQASKGEDITKEISNISG